MLGIALSVKIHPGPVRTEIVGQRVRHKHRITNAETTKAIEENVQLCFVFNVNTFIFICLKGTERKRG